MLVILSGSVVTKNETEVSSSIQSCTTLSLFVVVYVLLSTSDFRARVMNSGDDLISYNMGNIKKEDCDQSEIQLHKMKPQEHFIEAQVQEGDTLQAIALRFYCSVSISACLLISYKGYE